MSKHKKLANERAAILWEFYNAHDEEQLTCAKVFELTGKRASNLYHTFQIHGLTGPPIWDTKAAIRKRDKAALWAMAEKLGRGWLTVDEAAEAMGKPEKEVYLARRRYKGYIPEIRNKTNRRPRTVPQSDKEIEHERQPIDDGEGLQYYAVRPGPEPGQLIYSLR